MSSDDSLFRAHASAAVAVDPAVVERFLLDAGCFTGWRTGVAPDVHTSDPVLRVGSFVEFTLRIGPTRHPCVNIVSEHVPGRRLALRTTRGPRDVLTRVEWKPVAGGTEVAISHEVRSTEAQSRFLPLVRAAVRRMLRRDLANLKRLLETGGFEFTAPSRLTEHPPQGPLDPPPGFF